ncbi:pilS cassette [Neisseria meningitidis]|nr:pilS cassette [Neisseria meningitidis]MBG8682573.1 pilS cassette [Neisseria meningitidis]MBG8826660.1 pilS cassette [Neisseria meningitidis]MCI3218408.1 pilS cassette [Neisseria meningitidis]
MPAPPTRRQATAGITAKVKKPMFENSYRKPKNGFPPVRE